MGRSEPSKTTKQTGGVRRDRSLCHTPRVAKSRRGRLAPGRSLPASAADGSGTFPFIFARCRRVLSPSNGEAAHVPQGALPTRLSTIGASPEPYLRLENVYSRAPLGRPFLFSGERCLLGSLSPAVRPTLGEFRSTRGAWAILIPRPLWKSYANLKQLPKILPSPEPRIVHGNRGFFICWENLIPAIDGTRPHVDLQKNVSVGEILPPFRPDPSVAGGALEGACPGHAILLYPPCVFRRLTRGSCSDYRSPGRSKFARGTQPVRRRTRARKAVAPGTTATSAPSAMHGVGVGVGGTFCRASAGHGLLRSMWCYRNSESKN
jgi:hypothetical protein